MRIQVVLTLSCVALASPALSVWGGAAAVQTERPVQARRTAVVPTSDWKRLGQTELDPRGDRVEISLRSNIRALVLGTDSAAVRVGGIKVYLGDGEVVDWPIRGEMYPGQRTDVFDLPGAGVRRATKLVLFYETGLRATGRDWRRYRDWDRGWESRDNETTERTTDETTDRTTDREWDRNWERDYGQVRPVVTVWGREQMASSAVGWRRLGQSELDPREDRVEISLRADIRALVLGTDSAAVRVGGIKVYLSNGAVLDWPIRGEMYPGQRTDVFDLPGVGRRRVPATKLVLFYETGLRASGRDWRQHRDWDRRWDRDENRPSDREWDRNWESDYGQVRPVVTVWGSD